MIRFFVHRGIRKLGQEVLARLDLARSGIRYAIVPTLGAATRCLTALKKQASTPQDVLSTHFFLDGQSMKSENDLLRWASFYVVIFPESLASEGTAFWRDTGNGITSRHAEYCLARFHLLKSESENPSLCSQPPESGAAATEQPDQAVPSADAEELDIRTAIAKLATSEQIGQARVDTKDVFLYQGGMCAISATARAIAALSNRSEAVAYG